MLKKARQSLLQRSTSSHPHSNPSASQPAAASTQIFVMPTLAIRSAPPPPVPYPWVWKCHSCHNTYRLATTRRCLECGHEMCSSDGETASRSRQSPTKAGRRANKRRRTGGPCRSEFDYGGWAAWGDWKRGGMTAETKEVSFVDRSYNCADHCDYPSECHHTRYRIAQERFEAEAKAALDKPNKKNNGSFGSITVTNTITQLFSSAAEKTKVNVSASASSGEGPTASSLFGVCGDDDSDSDDSSDSGEADEILSNFMLEPSHDKTSLDDNTCEDDANSGLIIFGAIPEQLTQDEPTIPGNEQLGVELRDKYYNMTQLMADDEDEDDNDDDSLHLLQQRRSFSKVAQLTGLDSFLPPTSSSSTFLPSSIHSCSSEIVSNRTKSCPLPSLRPETSSDHISGRSLSTPPPVRLETLAGMTEEGSVTAWWVEFGQL